MGTTGEMEALAFRVVGCPAHIGSPRALADAWRCRADLLRLAMQMQRGFERGGTTALPSACSKAPRTTERQAWSYTAGAARLANLDVRRVPWLIRYFMRAAPDSIDGRCQRLMASELCVWWLAWAEMGDMQFGHDNETTVSGSPRITGGRRGGRPRD